MRLPSDLFKPARGAIATLACALTVGACGRSIGQPFEVAAADTLTPGKSTYEDAVARFGTASHFKGYGQGKVAHWHYLRIGPAAANIAASRSCSIGMVAWSVSWNASTASQMAVERPFGIQGPKSGSAMGGLQAA